MSACEMIKLFFTTNQIYFQTIYSFNLSGSCYTIYLCVFVQLLDIYVLSSFSFVIYKCNLFCL